MNLLKSFVLFAVIGLAYSQNCEDIAVQNVEFTEADRNLIVEWATDNDAECEFEIQYSSNIPDDTEEKFVTKERTFTFSNTVPCSTLTISVGTVGGKAVSTSITLERGATLAPVLRDMITSCNSIQMIWDAQPYRENMCELTQFQMLCLSDTHNFTIPERVSDVEHRTFDILITVLRPDLFYSCAGYMFTTLGGFSPASDTISFWSNLDSVHDLKVEETEKSLSASWDPPLNSEECGVAYDVTYENEVLGSSTVEVVGLTYEFDIELIPCTDYKITVTPIAFTGSKGTPVSTEFEPSVRVGEVENLQVIDKSDALVLAWDELNVGTCGVSYIVEYYVNGELSSRITTNTPSVEYDRITCATSSFTVQAVSEGISGSIAKQEIVLETADITSIGEVSNVRLEGDKIVWDAPESIGLCSISYVVEIENIFGQDEKQVSDTSINVDLVPCSGNKVTVTGVSGEVIGESGIFEIEAPSAEFSAPTHLQTIPSFNYADITLRADSISDNLCLIAAADVECSNDEGDSFARSLEVEDNDSRILNILLEDLQLDTIYTCEAKWKDSSSVTEFSFRTVALTPNILEISDINENSFTISWSEEYGKQFVSGYSLVVESLGPLHAVPDSCDIERSAVYSFDLDNSEQKQIFVEGFANYGYRVSLVTSYTLGVSIHSEQANAQTLTSDPDAPENLSVKWVRNDDTVYNVSAVLEWNTPCALNGRLNTYMLVINARFSLNGEELGSTVGGEVNVNEDVVNSKYDFEIVDINPFFTYNVAVYSQAASVGEPAILTLNPPGACACPSD